MNVRQFAEHYALWAQITAAIGSFVSAAESSRLLQQITDLPVRPSRAVRSLGCYVSRAGEPVCIRLQLAQEPEVLQQTFLHELAHLCDHLYHQPGIRYRRAHGPNWRNWASLLGAQPERCGESAALRQLYRQRLKLVAVCQRCGYEFHRTRRLNQRRKYFHRDCGGRLKAV